LSSLLLDIISHAEVCSKLVSILLYFYSPGAPIYSSHCTTITRRHLPFVDVYRPDNSIRPLFSNPAFVQGCWSGGSLTNLTKLPGILDVYFGQGCAASPYTLIAMLLGPRACYSFAREFMRAKRSPPLPKGAWATNPTAVADNECYER
jgi:hypothetical protein